jgi:hypothetical protein
MLRIFLCRLPNQRPLRRRKLWVWLVHFDSLLLKLLILEAQFRHSD